MVETTKLLELMSVKIFHDLAGPMGAVDNSIDLIADDNPLMKDKIIELMRTSSHAAISRLKFFRQSYGTAQDSLVHASILLSIAKEFLKDTKVQINWEVKEEEIDSYIGKSILNLIIISLNIMIYGGVISINHKDDNIVISLQGDNPNLSEDTKILLAGDLSIIKLTSANIQIYYTFLMIEKTGLKLSINSRKNEVQFILSH